MYEEDYDSYCEPMPEYLSEIENIIQSQIESRNEEILKENQNYKNKIDIKNKEIKELKDDIENIKSEIKTDKNKTILFNCILPKINIDNISKLLDFLGFKKTLDTGYSDLPQWKKIVLEYYDVKDFIFSLFDIANIKYDTRFKQYKLPRYFDKEELLTALKSGKMYRTNCNYLKDNYGNIESEYPLQEFFKNPNIKDNEVIQYIISKVNTEGSFYKIGEYVKLSDEAIESLAKTINYKGKLWENTTSFIEKHKNYLFEQKWFYDSTINKIDTENHYRTFYLSKYSDVFIIDYLSRKKNPLSMLQKLDGLSEDRSKNILKEIAKLL